MSITRTVLLIENDGQSAADIQRFLKLNDPTLSVSHTGDLLQAASFIQQRKPDIVLFSTGLLNDKTYGTLRKEISVKGIPLILLSDTGGEQLQVLALESGAVEAVVKNKINYFLLQKTIENILKLNESVADSKNQFTEVNKRNESYIQLLQQLDEGVLVLNSTNQIAFANERAYSAMAEPEIRERLAELLQYRNIHNQEVTELQAGARFVIRVRQQNIRWEDEPAALFLFERKESVPSAENIILNDDILQSIINNLTENVLLLKEDHILLANKPALAALNRKQTELNGKDIVTVLIAKEILHPVPASVISFFEAEEKEGDIKLTDGATKPIKFLIRPLNIAGALYQLLSFSIVENKAEQSIPKGTGDNMLSNESVLHLASHDLREPVRTILNYLQMVSDKISSQNYEEATEFAAYAKAAASGMDRLLSDLKVYTALGNHPFTLSRVSMKQVMADVMKQLKPAADFAEAEISYGELPEVNADRQLVEKLLFHLVDNAIKFRRKDKKPVIDIGFDKFEGNFIFCVRDNGIGISKKYYQKIFELFERLNRGEEYPGNGLGLPICKKITDMHGGELWVESLPGSGSNFYFTLKSEKA